MNTIFTPLLNVIAILWLTRYSLFKQRNHSEQEGKHLIALRFSEALGRDCLPSALSHWHSVKAWQWRRPPANKSYGTQLADANTSGGCWE